MMKSCISTLSTTGDMGASFIAANKIKVSAVHPLCHSENTQALMCFSGAPLRLSSVPPLRSDYYHWFKMSPSLC